MCHLRAHHSYATVLHPHNTCTTPAHTSFLQVVPSQGFTVQPGSSYTLRIAVADANHGLVDSLLMLPAGTLRLVRAPTAAAGGPYAVVSLMCNVA